jgi:hypothetical protein
MSTIFLDNKNGMTKALNFHDAQFKNECNAKLYTYKEKIYTNRFKDIITNFFPGSRIYKNYRKNFIAIKVEAFDKTKLDNETFVEFSKACDDRNITKVITASGSLIFRVDAAKIPEQMNGIINK